jgi:hypothetical protein
MATLMTFTSYELLEKSPRENKKPRQRETSGAEKINWFNAC